MCGPILEKSYHAEQHDDVERYSQLQGEIEWLKKKNGILELEMEQRALKSGLGNQLVKKLFFLYWETLLYSLFTGQVAEPALKYCEKLEKAAKREQILLEKIKAYESDLESTNKYFSGIIIFQY